MSENTTIKTTKTIYPQIYAYVLPEYKPNEGWIKIGYTERRNVDERIRQQTHTAGLTYSKLWSEPAKFHGSDEWFIDTHLHAYLRRSSGLTSARTPNGFIMTVPPARRTLILTSSAVKS